MADLVTDRKAAGYSVMSGMKQSAQTAQGRDANFMQLAQGALGTRGQANNKDLQELTRSAARKTGSQTESVYGNYVKRGGCAVFPSAGRLASAPQTGRSRPGQRQRPNFRTHSDNGFQRLLMAQTVEPSDTEKAIANFQALVERIPGVMAVRISGGKQLHEKRFVVVVPSLFDEATRGVYELRSNLFRKFPTANLDVRVEGIREGGRLS